MNRTIQDSASAMVKTGIWEDEEFIETHSIEDRFMLIYLLTCPTRHVSGIIKVNFRMMTSHLGWDKQQIQLVLDRLEKCGDIVVDENFIWIKAYFDHNSFPGPTLFQKMKSRLDEVSETLLLQWLEDSSQRGIPVDKIGYRYPIDRVPVNTNNNTNNTYKNNHNNTDHIENSVGGVNVKLIFPKSLDPRFVPDVRKCLNGNQDAQVVLDELAAALESGQVKSPVQWVSSVSKSLNRTVAGLKKEDIRKSISL